MLRHAVLKVVGMLRHASLRSGSAEYWANSPFLNKQFINYHLLLNAEKPGKWKSR